MEYYLKADTIYRVHSPAIFEMLSKVFDNQDYHYSFDLLEDEYYRIIKTEESIVESEFSRLRHQSSHPIGEFARRSLHPIKDLKRLYKLARWFRPESILEVGSCLGLSTLCLRLASPESNITGLEGNSQFVAKAKVLISKNKVKEIQFKEGLFESSLAQLTNDRWDFVMLDGDHQYDSTKSLIKNITPKLMNRSIIIMDDIHWSSDMYKAWKEIRLWPAFCCSVETLRWGILFTDKNLTPIHYNIISARYKIWQKYT